MEQEDRLRNLEINQAIIKHQLEENHTSDTEFKNKVLNDLDYLKERDIRVMTYIDGMIEKEEDKREIRQAIKAKLATSGLWGVIILLCTVAWYAFNNWVRNGATS